MEIRYDKAAIKYLQGLPKKLRDSIRSAIAGLTEQPPIGDIKPMPVSYTHLDVYKRQVHVSKVGGELVWLKGKRCCQASAAGQKPPIVFIEKLGEIGYCSLRRGIMA